MLVNKHDFYSDSLMTIGKCKLKLFDKNITLAKVLFESVLECAPKAVVIHPGSAAEYGPQGEGVAVTEDQVCAPATAYGRSKLMQTELAREYARQGLDVRVGRVFNIIAPQMPTNNVLGSVVAQLKNLKAGEPKKIKIGNTASVRDFLHIDEIGRAHV